MNEKISCAECCVTVNEIIADLRRQIAEAQRESLDTLRRLADACGAVAEAQRERDEARAALIERDARRCATCAAWYIPTRRNHPRYGIGACGKHKVLPDPDSCNSCWQPRPESTP